MPSNLKKYYSNFLREETTPKFAKVFKGIVLNKDLSYGCRIFLLCLTVVPFSSEYSDRKYGRKLGVAGKQIAKWRHEAEEKYVQISFRPLF